MRHLTNLALHRPADQSSICEFSIGATTAEDAAHGNDGRIGGAATLHTGVDGNPWWMVDLGSVCEIHRFVLFNRMGLESRLRHFTVLGSDDGTEWRPIFAKQDDTEFGGADGLPFEHDLVPPAQARLVRICQDDGPFLHFEECEILGLRAPPVVLPTEGPAPVLGGRADPGFFETDEFGGFGLRSRHERLTLFPSLLPPQQQALRVSTRPHPVVVEEHYGFPTPPAVHAYAVHGGRLWDRGLVTVEGRFVMSTDCIPAYLLPHVTEDAHSFPIRAVEPERWPSVRRIVSARPVASPFHQNVVYGHFLLEMLPRLYGLSLLQQCGVDFAVAIDRALPQFIKDFAVLYFGEDDLIWYDKDDEIVCAPSIIMTSMMHTNYNLHPAFNLMVADLRGRVGLVPVPRGPRSPAPGRSRIYLSRSRVGYNDRLQNADEIEALMRRAGFAVIHPQTMSIAEQLELFDGAELVAGEYTSALHNTLFSRPGTQVISIDFFSWYQSMIGRLRRQPHRFVAPADGEFRNWRLPQGSNRVYTVDPGVMAAQIFAATGEAVPLPPEAVPDAVPDAVPEVMPEAVPEAMPEDPVPEPVAAELVAELAPPQPGTPAPPSRAAPREMEPDASSPAWQVLRGAAVAAADPGPAAEARPRRWGWLRGRP